MATQRYISTSFWTDKWIRKLDPSERYIYLYLLTNTQTNIAGVYEITIDRIAFDTGYDERTLRPILDRFADAGKAHFYDEEWMILPAWPKHQRYSQRGKVLAGIRAILAGLPEDVYAQLKSVGYDLQLETDDQPSPRPKRQKIRKSLRESIIDRDGAVCAFCGSSEELEIDHITPVSMGGTNDPSNLRVLCRSCNGKRNAELRWDENGRVMGRDGWTIEGHPEKWVSNGWSTNYSDTDTDTDTDADSDSDPEGDTDSLAPDEPSTSGWEAELGTLPAVQKGDPLVKLYVDSLGTRLPRTAWTDLHTQYDAARELAQKTRDLLPETPIDDEYKLAQAILFAFAKKKADAKHAKSDYWRDVEFTPRRLLQRFPECVSALASTYEREGEQRRRDEEGEAALARMRGEG